MPCRTGEDDERDERKLELCVGAVIAAMSKLPSKLPYRSSYHNLKEIEQVLCTSCGLLSNEQMLNIQFSKDKNLYEWYKEHLFNDIYTYDTLYDISEDGLSIRDKPLLSEGIRIFNKLTRIGAKIILTGKSKTKYYPGITTASITHEIIIRYDADTEFSEDVVEFYPGPIYELFEKILKIKEGKH